MGGPRLLLSALALLVILAAPAGAAAFPLEGYEWVWCFGKHNVQSRLASDLSLSAIAGADIRWMNPAGYLVDDGAIAGTGPHGAYNDMLSILQEAYNGLDSSSKKPPGDIYLQAKAMDGISFGISEYGGALSVRVEESIRREIERTGLNRIEEVIPLGPEKTSAAKFYEKVSDERSSEAVRSRNLEDVERFGAAWADYLGKYSAFAESERSVFFNLVNCSGFSAVSLRMCNFDDASYWTCGIVAPGCLPWALCRDRFERDASLLKTYPPNAKETIAALKLHSPLPALKEKYSEFVSLTKKARDAEAALRAENERLANAIEEGLARAEADELWAVNSTVAERLYSSFRQTGVLQQLRARPSAHLPPSDTMEKIGASLKEDRKLLGRIAGRQEKYSEESRAFLYNRIRDSKSVNDRLAGQKDDLAKMLEGANELDMSASKAIEERKSALLGMEEVTPLDRLKIAKLAYPEENPLGWRLLWEHDAILELDGVEKRAKERGAVLVEGQLEELEGRASGMSHLLEVARSPVTRTFADGMHGEELPERSLGRISSVPESVKPEIVKIRRSDEPHEKKLLMLGLGMRLDSALEELNRLNDDRHATGVNAARMEALKMLGDVRSAGLNASWEERELAGYERDFVRRDWIGSENNAFGFMGWLESRYGSLAGSLMEKFEKNSESFFSGLRIEARYALQETPTADKPVLVRAEFTIANPSSLEGRGRTYAANLSLKPVEKIGPKNVIDGSDGMESVYSGGDRLYMKVKSLKAGGSEFALIEYYAEPVARTSVSKSESASSEAYLLERNATVACYLDGPVNVEMEIGPEAESMKVAAFSMGREMGWQIAGGDYGPVIVRDHCSFGSNHTIRLAAEAASPIEVSLSRETNSTAGSAIISHVHRLEAKNRLKRPLKDVEIKYELPGGASDVKLNGKSGGFILDGSTLYWTVGAIAPRGSATATVAFSTASLESPDMEIARILNSLPDCGWESCCNIGWRLEEKKSEAEKAGDDEVARYLAKTDFLLWLKKNLPLLESFSRESAAHPALQKAKEEMCALRVSKALDEVRKAEAEKARVKKEEKSGLQAKALLLRREARLLDERLLSLQAAAKAFPNLLKAASGGLVALKNLGEGAQESIILAEKEGNETRLMEADATLSGLREGLEAQAKSMADALHDFSKPSRKISAAVSGEIVAKVEERFPGAVIQQAGIRETDNRTFSFAKSYSEGDYEGALQLALDGGLEREGPLLGDAKGKIALASSKLAELDRLVKIKKTGSERLGEAAGFLEDSKKALSEGRFTDASYLALYAYATADEVSAEIAGLKTPIDIRPLAAIALLAAGFVVYNNRRTVKRHPAKPKTTTKQNGKEAEDFFGELK